jgi:hypothetical protein
MWPGKFRSHPSLSWPRHAGPNPATPALLVAIAKSLEGVVGPSPLVELTARPVQMTRTKHDAPNQCLIQSQRPEPIQSYII